MRAPLPALLFTLTLLLAGCASAPTAQPMTTAAATPATAPLAMHAPLPKLFTAGQPQASQWRQVKDAGVATVINLRPADEAGARDETAEVTAAGMHYVNLPIASHDDINFANAAKLHALLQDTNGPVLLHCASGNRAGALLAVSLAQAGMPVEQALQIGRDAGMRGAEARVREVLQLPAQEQKIGLP